MTDQEGKGHPEHEGPEEQASQAAPHPRSEDEEPRDEAEQVRAELEEARREKEQFRNLAQRAQADLINYKRRVEEERQDFERQVTSRLLLKLLEIMDDFERALAHVPAEDEQEPWVEGIRMIFQKMNALLEAEGVAKIQAQGQPFDPWEHEALFHEEAESLPEGHVVQVIREGYRLRDRVLRPAQVSVARAGQTTQGQQSSTTENDQDPAAGAS